MGLAGLDQIQQAGGVQRVFPGQALGGHGEAGRVGHALAAGQRFAGQQAAERALQALARGEASEAGEDAPCG